jgi:hydroxylaminobenzene mutase
MDKKPSQPLLTAGALLILLSFILGMILPVFTNPRMALSAHQQGIIAGILLMLMGFVQSHAILGSISLRHLERLLISGAYSLWTGILFSAVFGTSRATPIAGDGYIGSRWQEISVSIVLLAGSLMLILGLIFLLTGLVRYAKKY